MEAGRGGWVRIRWGGGKSWGRGVLGRGGCRGTSLEVGTTVIPVWLREGWQEQSHHLPSAFSFYGITHHPRESFSYLLPLPEGDSEACTIKYYAQGRPGGLDWNSGLPGLGGVCWVRDSLRSGRDSSRPVEAHC